MVRADRVTEIALSLPGATSAAHFDRTAFRVPRRIFATLGPGGRDLNVRLDPELQAAAVEARPRAFAAIENAWGKAGWTRCDLDAVAEEDLVRVLTEAHALAGLPAPGQASRGSGKGATKKATTRSAAAPAKSRAAKPPRSRAPRK